MKLSPEGTNESSPALQRRVAEKKMFKCRRHD